jgi:hypothetical protein
VKKGLPVKTAIVKASYLARRKTWAPSQILSDAPRAEAARAEKALRRARNGLRTAKRKLAAAEAEFAASVAAGDIIPGKTPDES